MTMCAIKNKNKKDYERNSTFRGRAFNLTANNKGREVFLLPTPYQEESFVLDLAQLCIGDSLRDEPHIGVPNSFCRNQISKA